MIAPMRRACKRSRDAGNDAVTTAVRERALLPEFFPATCRKLTFSLVYFTMKPYFGQARAVVTGDNNDTWIGPGHVRAPDSSAPQPPGVWIDRALVPRH